MKRLLKKEIKLLSTEDLNTRYCYILSRGEKFNAKDIPISDAREILWIEDELRERIIKAVGHDFYPPDRIEEKKPTQSAETKPKIGTKIKFRAIVKSSLGTKVAEINKEANSKAEADILIRKEIRKLGLTGVTYKIS